VENLHTCEPRDDKMREKMMYCHGWMRSVK
jgi:hypothetical protein